MKIMAQVKLAMNEDKEQSDWGLLSLLWEKGKMTLEVLPKCTR